jgi:hypothetical protein
MGEKIIHVVNLFFRMWANKKSPITKKVTGL